MGTNFKQVFIIETEQKTTFLVVRNLFGFTLRIFFAKCLLNLNNSSMNMSEANRIIDNFRDLEESLMKEVKIPHYEVDRLIVNRLIAIRNSVVNKNQDMSHIDKTIKFFLTEDEFNEYALKNKDLQF